MQSSYSIDLDKTASRSNDNVTIQIQLQDYTCTITQELLFQPSMILPCEHIFEEIELLNHKSKHDDCPVCRGEITEIVTAPRIFNEQLENLFIQRPDLIQERYFNLNYLIDALIESDTNMLDKIIHFLLKAPKYINEISTAEGFKGTSPVYWLAVYPEGIKLLAKYKKLRELINLASLNSVALDEWQATNAVYWLASSDEGIQLLIDDPEFCAKITADGLNNSIEQTGKMIGTTPVTLLASSESGIQLLQSNAALRAKISPVGLNTTKKIDEAGINAVFLLTESHAGQTLLASDPTLCAKITIEGLNTVLSNNSFAHGTTPVYWLASRLTGIELLTQNAELRRKIQPQGLNTQRQVGEDIGTSAVYWLARTEKGQQLLVNDAELCAMISPLALNAINADPESDNCCPIDFMQRTSNGQHLLSLYPKWRKRVTNTATRHELEEPAVIASESPPKQADAKELLKRKIVKISRHSKLPSPKIVDVVSPPPPLPVVEKNPYSYGIFRPEPSSPENQVIRDRESEHEPEPEYEPEREYAHHQDHKKHGCKMM